MNKVFKVYKDSRNEWLAVKQKDLAAFGLLSLVSPLSRVKGQTVYLVNGSTDYASFQAEYEVKHGPLTTAVTDHGERSWVRNMASFRSELTLTEATSTDKEEVVTE